MGVGGTPRSRRGFPALGGRAEGGPRNFLQFLVRAPPAGTGVVSGLRISQTIFTFHLAKRTSFEKQKLGDLLNIYIYINVYIIFFSIMCMCVCLCVGFHKNSRSSRAEDIGGYELSDLGTGAKL